MFKVKKINIYIYLIIFCFTTQALRADIKQEMNHSYSKISDCFDTGNCKKLELDYEILSSIIITFDKTLGEKYLSHIINSSKNLNNQAKITILTYAISKLSNNNKTISSDLMYNIFDKIELKQMKYKDLYLLLSLLNSAEVELFSHPNLPEIVKLIWINHTFDSDKLEIAFFLKYKKYFDVEVFNKKILQLLLRKNFKSAEKINNFLTTSIKVKEENEEKIKIAKICQNIKKYPQSIFDTIYSIKSQDDGLNILLANCMIAAGKSEYAIKFLSKIKIQDNLIDDAMFVNQKLATVELMSQKKYNHAIEILKAFTPKSREALVSHQWYLGWINLEFLNKPKEAVKYFQNILDNSSFALSASRGNYWLARTYEKMSDFSNSISYYQKAANYPTTFYGQAAIKKLGKRLKDEIDNYITGETLAKKNQNSLFKTGVLLNKYGLEEFSLLLIQDSLVNLSKDEILNTLYNSSLVLKKYDLMPIARYATRFGIFIPKVSYPKVFSDLDSLTSAIIRQESGLSISAISNKGAMGLMQVIPETAKIISKQLGVEYSAQKMLTDKEYNIKIGMIYIKQMLANFNQNKIMALAAYNAGPAPIRRWKATFGDPSYMQEDEIINWIESITYSQTRDYVMRVMENFEMYDTIY